MFVEGISVGAIILILKRRVNETGSQKKVAKQLGISAQYLGDILQGRREPGEKVLKTLKLKRVVLYQDVQI